MNILLANPRGFCAGVDRAIEIVDRALALFGAPIYVRHEVVHNKVVVSSLKAKGAVFVEEVEEIPDGATAIFSAHGVSREVRERAAARGLRVFDATCPLVTKVHMEVRRYLDRGYEVVLIGHAGHPEVEGTLGQHQPGEPGAIHLVEAAEDVAALRVRDPERLAFTTQTTLSLDDTAGIVVALRARFPGITAPRRDDICYATQNRQNAVKQLAAHCDLMIVVGSRNSSNTNRLREIAEKLGVAARQIDGPEQIERAWLEGRKAIGVTAGASAPEHLVQGVVARLREWGAAEVREYEGLREQVVFSIPRELRSP
jgi:4-hydroxy-3-methylbut-2-enyl diphosphate reductase